MQHLQRPQTAAASSGVASRRVQQRSPPSVTSLPHAWLITSRALQALHTACRSLPRSADAVAGGATPAATTVSSSPPTGVPMAVAPTSEADIGSHQAPVQDTPSLDVQIWALQQLLSELATLPDVAAKVEALYNHPLVIAFCNDSRNAAITTALLDVPTQEQYLLLCLLAAGQSHVLSHNTSFLQSSSTPDASAPSSSDTNGSGSSIGSGSISSEQQAVTQLTALAATLQRVETFYDGIGGVLGYQLKSLQLIRASGGGASGSLPSQQPSTPSEALLVAPDGSPLISLSSVDGSNSNSSSSTLSTSSSSNNGSSMEPGSSSNGQLADGADVQYHVPRSVDLAGEFGRQAGLRAAAKGLEAMPLMAEIYPVGGAGDRLGLLDDVTGECLPAAMLPYCGRSMMEGLIRDLQAREYLYYKLTGRQLITPVAVMTSDAKGNHRRMSALLESLNWMGRGRTSFKLFRQPLVPVINVTNGRWLLDAPLTPMTKPGGHGAIWKLMWDDGVFEWLSEKGVKSALVRQISNPLAGTDNTLLALAGSGYGGGHTFGFMSCERAVGAAEGMNVLQERRVWRQTGPGGEGHWDYQYGVTNVEYTEFERLGINDEAAAGSSNSVFPANTNVLYIGLDAVNAVVKQAIATANSEQLLPGLIFNTKKKVTYKCPLLGTSEQFPAGRMESTMQNMADHLADAFDRRQRASEVADRLSTFMVYNLRRKVTSSAKKKLPPGSRKIHQTPDGSFFDLQRNAWHLLQLCGLSHVPEVGSVEQYLAKGPGFIFLFHPALGPLWDVIAQKIRGGALMQGAELVLEVAEARLSNVTINGSLLVHARNPLGHLELPEDGSNSSNGGSSSSSSGSNGSNGSSLLLPSSTARSASTTTTSQHSGSSSSSSTGEHTNWSSNYSPSSKLATPSASPSLTNSSSSHAASNNGDGRGGSSSNGIGSSSNGISADGRVLRYSDRTGRVRLEDVVITNAGIDWSAPSNLYWRHAVARRESVRIELQGRSEFEAFNVRISGAHTFVVPDGFKMTVSAAQDGSLLQRLTPLPEEQPSWEWEYGLLDNGEVQLEFVDHSLEGVEVMVLPWARSAERHPEYTFDYII